MVSLREFARRMDKRADSLGTVANERKKIVAKAVLQTLVRSTPVDTSNALSNWQIGVGEAVQSDRGPYFFGAGGSTEAQSAQAALAVGFAKIDAAKPGETIYISNLADYIRELNTGTIYSKPGGFVEKAISVGRMAGKRARGK